MFVNQLAPTYCLLQYETAFLDSVVGKYFPAPLFSLSRPSKNKLQKGRKPPIEQSSSQLVFLGLSSRLHIQLLISEDFLFPTQLPFTAHPPARHSPWLGRSAQGPCPE